MCLGMEFCTLLVTSVEQVGLVVEPGVLMLSGSLIKLQGVLSLVLLSHITCIFFYNQIDSLAMQHTHTHTEVEKERGGGGVDGTVQKAVNNSTVSYTVRELRLNFLRLKLT